MNDVNEVEIADLDGDGDNDVLVATYDNNTVAWYENNGSGSFGSANLISSVVNGVESIYVADLDQDDDLDVLSASTGMARSRGTRTMVLEDLVNKE